MTAVIATWGEQGWFWSANLQCLMAAARLSQSLDEKALADALRSGTAQVRYADDSGVTRAVASGDGRRVVQSGRRGTELDLVDESSLHQFVKTL